MVILLFSLFSCHRGEDDTGCVAPELSGPITVDCTDGTCQELLLTAPTLADGSSATYSWSFDDGSSASGSTVVRATPLVGEVATLTATTRCGSAETADAYGRITELSSGNVAVIEGSCVQGGVTWSIMNCVDPSTVYRFSSETTAPTTWAPSMRLVEYTGTGCSQASLNDQWSPGQAVQCFFGRSNGDVRVVPEVAQKVTLTIGPVTAGVVLDGVLLVQHAYGGRSGAKVVEYLCTPGASRVGVSDLESDADADGYQDATAGGDDCDDTDAAVHPDATESWYDGVDQDCSSGSDFDADADGHDSASFAGDDCDDTDASVYPGAKEIPGDGVDQDCDGGD